MTIHAVIHCGTDKHRGFRGAHKTAQKIIADTARELRHDIRRRWCDNHQIRLISQRDMLDAPFGFVHKHFMPHRIPCQTPENLRADKPHSLGRHHNVGIISGSSTEARKLARLIHRDACRHAES
jgi:hypothetical protein